LTLNKEFIKTYQNLVGEFLPLKIIPMATLAYLQLTRKCNQKCRFCSNPPSGWKDLILSQIKKTIEQYIKEKYDGVIFTGGEPTLYKYLPEIIKYCSDKKFPCRIITNGQKTAQKKYLQSLIVAGLQHIHVSIYSHQSKTQAFLTQNKDSLKNIKATLSHLNQFKQVRVDVNITINKYNVDHLYQLVKFIIRQYPYINHFVFNNLDPSTDRTAKNPETIPRLNDFELELIKALKFLEKNKRTFRVERVPLCYLPEFEYCSTETRKIVKKETRPIYFLDQKGFWKQENFFYQKSPICQNCHLSKICAGLYGMGKYYSEKELYPVFVAKGKIIQKILS
jgi:MoaA/NifB/PqqE/SkfB family radical SAM enzyme